MSSFHGSRDRSQALPDGEQGLQLPEPSVTSNPVRQSVVRSLEARSLGILVPVPALRSKTELGIGDTGSVRDAIDFCVQGKITILQVLPINETGGDNSPYLPLSNFAFDPMLLEMTPETVPGLTDADLISIHANSIGESLSGPAIDYSSVRSVKTDLLRRAFSQFSAEIIAGEGPLVNEYREFCARYHEDLSKYSLFRSLTDRYGGNSNWSTWEPAHQNWQSASEWLALSPEKESIQHNRDFYSYVQFVARRQWLAVREYADARGIELVGDIPFGVNRCSCDVWSNQGLFDLDWSLGAPAEPQFKEDLFLARWGQNWGAPMYNWENHAAEGFAWWRRRVQLTTEVFSSFRFDHALGGFRVYAFPWSGERNNEFTFLSHEEAKTRTGGRLPHFIPGPDWPEASAHVNEENGRRFFTMLKEAAGAAGIIAEDLGATTPEYVRKVLNELDIPGFFIPSWHRRGENGEFYPVQEAAVNAVATFGTHDHEPYSVMYQRLVTEWQGPNGHQAWLELKRWMHWMGTDQMPPTTFNEELQMGLIRTLLQTPSRLVILNLPDLLGTEERWNSPGATGAGNWTTRLPAPLTTMQEQPRISRVVQFLADEIGQAGRARLLDE